MYYKMLRYFNFKQELVDKMRNATFSKKVGEAPLYFFMNLYIVILNKKRKT